MRFIAIAFLMISNIVASAQIKNTDVEGIATKTIADERLVPFMDSLALKLISDTLKFDRKDLVNTSLGTQNSINYSPLFVVNGNCQYKLDIVNGSAVIAFTREILVPSKVASVYTMNVPSGQSIFGTRGSNGVVFIMMKENVKVNLFVAGLKWKLKDQRGDNFDQRKEGEPIIRR